MPEGPSQRPNRPRRAGSRPSHRPTRTSSGRNRRGAGLRRRLKRDSFLFMLCLGTLGFVTWAFALTWWVTGAVVPLALALASVAPAVFLFYLRDA